MNGFEKLATWLDEFAGALAPAEQRQLARHLGSILKRQMVNRIRSNVDPDGIRFVPKKRDSIGRIRKSLMFDKLHQRIKVVARADAVEIGFSGRNALIAAIHHYGKVDKPAHHARPVRYAVRPLVGFSEEDVELVRREVIKFFTTQI